MDQPKIFAKLEPIFRKIFNDDAIVLSDGLTANDVANWDSLTHMMMIGEVETAFAVRFKLKELGKLTNVGDLATLIQQKLAA